MKLKLLFNTAAAEWLSVVEGLDQGFDVHTGGGECHVVCIIFDGVKLLLGRLAEGFRGISHF